MTVPPRPPMPTQEDSDRAALQESIYQVLRDDWEDLLCDWLEATIGPERAAIWGKPDTSVNLLADFSRQVTTPGLYGSAPELRGPPGTERMRRIMEAAGVWTRNQHVEYMTVGLVDFLVRPQVDPSGLVSTRLVPPHNIYAIAHPDDPTRPVAIWELRLRSLYTESGDPVYLWAWDQYDIRPGLESYRIVAAQQCTIAQDVNAPTGISIPKGVVLNDKQPITNLFVSVPAPEDENGELVGSVPAPADGFVGDDYPFRDFRGFPYLPWVWYRAMDTGSLWGTIYRQGPFRGTLNAALLSTYSLHAARDATGSMTLVFNAQEPTGAGIAVGSKASNRSIAVSPGSMLFLKSLDGSQPSVSQIGPGANLQPLALFARSYMGQTASRFGIASKDLTNLSNPQSAAAMVLSNEERREFSARMEPLFRGADLRLTRILASLLNSTPSTGGGFPEQDYSIEYTSLPSSAFEEEADRDQAAFELQQGIKSEVDMWLDLHPGATRDNAISALTQVARDQAELAMIRRQAAADAGLSPDEVQTTNESDA